MSTDEDYSSFLDKANQDTGAKKKASSKSASTKAVNTDIPDELEKVDVYYTSEADEPFEPVSLKWEEKGLPGDDNFGHLIGHDGEVSEMTQGDFDPRGDYKEVIDVVKKAGTGKVKIFRIDHGKTRAEYYVVSVDSKGSRLIGLKAKAVES